MLTAADRWPQPRSSVLCPADTRCDCGIMSECAESEIISRYLNLMYFWFMIFCDAVLVPLPSAECGAVAVN